MRSEVYIHDQIQKVYELHQNVIEKTDEKTTLIEQLTGFSNTLYAAWKARNPVCKPQINNWHPDYLGKDLDIIFRSSFKLEDARLSIAKDCGFLDWKEVEEKGKIPFDLAFEKAVDTLLVGDIGRLKTQIAANPSLLHTRSRYGHGATLLHYAGSNGVEMWRQKTPYNLPEIVQFLLDAGADKKATMRVYGGHFTTWEMVATSAHPHAAGVVGALKKIFCKQGFE